MFYYLSDFLRQFQSAPVRTALTAILALLISAIVLISLVRWLRRRSQDHPETLLGLVTGSLGNVLKVLVGLGILAVLTMHLRFESGEFARLRGGTSQRNYEAVTKIWGTPHAQRELTIRMVQYSEKYFDKDGLEFDAEKLKASSQPIAFRKSRIEETVAGDPVCEADHKLNVKMNYRRMGNASYPCFDIDGTFSYAIENFSGKDATAICTFPLPAGQGLVDKLSASIDGKSIADATTVTGENLNWQMPLPAGQRKKLVISYSSRGIDHLRLDPGAGRQLRKYDVQLVAQGVKAADLTPPMGCMSPMVRTDKDGAALLEWHLGQAVTRLGMGATLPKEKQEGYYVAKVLDAAPWALVLLVGMVLVTYLATGRSPQYGPLVLLAMGFDLYYLLMANIGDYWPGLVGGMIISGALLTALTAWLNFKRTDRFAAGSTVAFFLVFCVAWPLFIISDYANLLTSILYVGLLAWSTALLVLPQLRKAPPQAAS